MNSCFDPTLFPVAMGERLLFLSWGVPPLPSGSAVIVGNLAQQFSATEMIVAGERPFHQPPVSWRVEWPRLVYIASDLPPTWRGSRWWRRLQVPLMLVRTLWLIRKFHCTCLLAVFPNEEFLLVGYLSALWSGVPLSIYFHNTYVENRQGLGLRFGRWLQRRVFANARRVFVMSEGMVELYRKRYPGLRCSALVHSFNEPIRDFGSMPAPHSPIRLTISGNLNESCRDAAIRFSESVLRMDNVSLNLLSGTSRTYLQDLGLLRNGTRHETVARDRLMERLEEADIVVLLHGFTGKISAEELSTMFPTKTIEYLICGRPILAHTPPDCFLTDFLKQHQCALVVDTPSVAALVEAVERLRTDHDLRASLVRHALHAAKMFYAPQVAETLRSSLGRHDYASDV